jgi:phage FluMu gp28-like protein
VQLVAPQDDSEEYALLEYQRRWFYDRSKIKVSAKSRQIGITWTTAAEAVVVAASAHGEGGLHVYFMTTSQEDARGFIEDCSKWIGWFTPMIQACAEASDIIEGDDWFTDSNGSAILAYRIDFPSGYSIFALPTRPAKMRGKKDCYAILDEAAQAPVDEWMTAAAGSLMWAGRLAIISTYFGTDNEFYRLVQRARAAAQDRIAEGRPHNPAKDISLHETYIYDALEQGLFRRMCRKSGQRWSAQAEVEYVEWLRTTVYPGTFPQECEGIADQGGGKKIPHAVVERCLTLGPDICTIFEVEGGAVPTAWVNGDQVGRATESWDTEDAGAAEAERRLNTMRQWLETHVAPALERINREGDAIHAGLDYGRTTNLSVFTLAAVKRSRVREARLVIELENVPWPEQDLVQDFLWAHLRNLRGGAADKGGNGGPSAERCQLQTAGVIKAVNINSGWHNPKFTTIEKHLLAQSWLLPRHHGPMLGDLTSLRTVKGKIVAPQRTTTTGRRQKRHADGAFSLALCEQSVEVDGPPSIPKPKPRKIRRITRAR